MSPASNRIRENSQVEEDENQLTVDGQESGTTVCRLLKRRNNKKGAQPKSSRATKQTQLPEERPNLMRIKSTAKLSRFEDEHEEEYSAGKDDLMPQLISDSTPKKK